MAWMTRFSSHIAIFGLIFWSFAAFGLPVSDGSDDSLWQTKGDDQRWRLQGGSRDVFYPIIKNNTENVPNQRTSLLKVEFEAWSHQFTLDLEQNRHHAVHGAKEIFVASQHIIGSKEIPTHCNYHGIVEEIPGSFVSIDVCNGLRGVILSGSETLLIEPLHLADQENKLGEHVISENGVTSDWRRLHTTSRPTHHRRIRREVTNEMKYVIADILVSKSFIDRNISTSQARTIVSLANIFLKPFKIDIIIRNEVIFMDEDPVEYSSNLHMMLADLENYVRNTSSYEDMATPLEERADVTQYLIGVEEPVSAFDRNNFAFGAATLGTMCTPRAVGLVKHVGSGFLIQSAGTVARNIARNIGLLNEDYYEMKDDVGCSCSNDRCVMSPDTSVWLNAAPSVFAQCTIHEYQNILRASGLQCLYDRPATSQTICGDGYVNEGEECDCGVTGCSCCDDRCLFTEGSECQDGECCNQCKLMSSGVICREATGECDVADRCDGVSGECPVDDYLHDGTQCGNGKGYCYRGRCPTLDDQCRSSMGDAAVAADAECYQGNTVGAEPDGRCGVDSLSLTGGNYNVDYAPCAPENALCGALKCVNVIQLNGVGFETLDANMDGTCSALWVSDYAQSDFSGLGDVTYGTKCAEGRVCWEYNCTSIEDAYSLDRCPTATAGVPCSGNGICTRDLSCICNGNWTGYTCNIPLITLHITITDSFGDPLDEATVLVVSDNFTYQVSTPADSGSVTLEVPLSYTERIGVVVTKLGYAANGFQWEFGDNETFSVQLGMLVNGSLDRAVDRNGQEIGDFRLETQDGGSIEVPAAEEQSISDSLPGYLVVNGPSPILPETVIVGVNGSLVDIEPFVAVEFSLINEMNDEIKGLVNVTFRVPVEEDSPLSEGDVLPTFYFDESTGLWMQDGYWMVTPGNDNTTLFLEHTVPRLDSWVIASALELVDTTTPEETTPVERTTPQETTPVETTTPEETTPVETTTPEETTPVETTPIVTTPVETTTLEDTTPVETTPIVATPVGTTALEETTPVQTRPIVTTPVETTTPEDTTPVETTPIFTTPVETTTPEDTTPVETTTPEDTTPVETTPIVTTPVETTTPEDTTPVETTPIVTTPVETTTPEDTTPVETTTVETTTPEDTTQAALTVSTFNSNGSPLFDTNILVVDGQNEAISLNTSPDSNTVQINQTISQDGNLGIIATKQGYATNGFLWQPGDITNRSLELIEWTNIDEIPLILSGGMLVVSFEAENGATASFNIDLSPPLPESIGYATSDGPASYLPQGVTKDGYGEIMTIYPIAAMDLALLLNGAREEIEIQDAVFTLPLPSDSGFTEGDNISAYMFNEETGLWIESGQGEVILDDDSNLVWRYTAEMPSSWLMAATSTPPSSPTTSMTVISTEADTNGTTGAEATTDGTTGPETTTDGTTGTETTTDGTPGTETITDGTTGTETTTDGTTGTETTTDGTTGTETTTDGTTGTEATTEGTAGPETTTDGTTGTETTTDGTTGTETTTDGTTGTETITDGTTGTETTTDGTTGTETTTDDTTGMETTTDGTTGTEATTEGTAGPEATTDGTTGRETTTDGTTGTETTTDGTTGTETTTDGTTGRETTTDGTTGMETTTDVTTGTETTTDGTTGTETTTDVTTGTETTSDGTTGTEITTDGTDFTEMVTDDETDYTELVSELVTEGVTDYTDIITDDVTDYTELITDYEYATLITDEILTDETDIGVTDVSTPSTYSPTSSSTPLSNTTATPVDLIQADLSISTYDVYGAPLFDTDVLVIGLDRQISLRNTGLDSNVVLINETIPADGRLGIVVTKDLFAPNGFQWQYGDDTNRSLDLVERTIVPLMISNGTASLLTEDGVAVRFAATQVPENDAGRIGYATSLGQSSYLPQTVVEGVDEEFENREPLTAIDVALSTDDGEVLDLVDVEFLLPLPSGGGYQAGDNITAYVFNEDTGIWVEDGYGFVVAGSNSSLAWRYIARNPNSWIMAATKSTSPPTPPPPPPPTPPPPPPPTGNTSTNATTPSTGNLTTVATTTSVGNTTTDFTTPSTGNITTEATKLSMGSTATNATSPSIGNLTTVATTLSVGNTTTDATTTPTDTPSVFVTDMTEIVTELAEETESVSDFGTELATDFEMLTDEVTDIATDVIEVTELMTEEVTEMATDVTDTEISSISTATNATQASTTASYVVADLMLSIFDNNDTPLTNSNVRVVERDNILAEVNTGNESTFEMAFNLPSHGRLGVIVTKDGFASNGFQWQDGEESNLTIHLMGLDSVQVLKFGDGFLARLTEDASAEFSINQTTSPGNLSANFALASGDSRTVPEAVTEDDLGNLVEIQPWAAVYFSVDNDTDMADIRDVVLNITLDIINGLDVGDNLTAFQFNEDTGLWDEDGYGSLISGPNSSLTWRAVVQNPKSWILAATRSTSRTTPPPPPPPTPPPPPPPTGNTTTNATTPSTGNFTTLATTTSVGNTTTDFTTPSTGNITTVAPTLSMGSTATNATSPSIGNLTTVATTLSVGNTTTDATTTPTDTPLVFVTDMTEIVTELAEETESVSEFGTELATDFEMLTDEVTDIATDVIEVTELMTEEVTEMATDVTDTEISSTSTATNATPKTTTASYVVADLMLSIFDNNNNTPLTNSNVRVVERDNILAEVNTGNESTFEMAFNLPSDGRLGVIVTKDGFASNGFQWQDGEETNLTIHLMGLDSVQVLNFGDGFLARLTEDASAQFSINQTTSPGNLSANFALASGDSRTVPEAVTEDDLGDLVEIQPWAAVYFSVNNDTNMADIMDVVLNITLDGINGLDVGDNLTAFQFNEDTGLWDEDGYGSLISGPNSSLIWRAVVQNPKSWILAATRSTSPTTPPPPPPPTPPPPPPPTGNTTTNATTPSTGNFTTLATTTSVGNTTTDFTTPSTGNITTVATTLSMGSTATNATSPSIGNLTTVATTLSVGNTTTDATTTPADTPSVFVTDMTEIMTELAEETESVSDFGTELATDFEMLTDEVTDIATDVIEVTELMTEEVTEMATDVTDTEISSTSTATNATPKTTTASYVVADLMLSIFDNNNNTPLTNSNVRVVERDNILAEVNTGNESTFEMAFNLPSDGRLGVIVTKDGFASNGFQWQDGEETNLTIHLMGLDSVQVLNFDDGFLARLTEDSSAQFLINRTTSPGNLSANFALASGDSRTVPEAVTEDDLGNLVEIQPWAAVYFSVNNDTDMANIKDVVLNITLDGINGLDVGDNLTAFQFNEDTGLWDAYGYGSVIPGPNSSLLLVTVVQNPQSWILAATRSITPTTPPPPPPPTPPPPPPPPPTGNGTTIATTPSTMTSLAPTPVNGTDSPPVNGTDSTLVNGTDLTPVNGTDSTPLNRTDSTPVNGTDSTPVNGTDSTPVNGTDSTPVNGTYSTPVNGTDSTPVNGTDSTPVNGTDSTPVNGTDSTPVNGTDSAPLNGTDSTPVNGTDSTPVNGTDSPPVNGTDSTPVNGTDSTPVNGTDSAPLNGTDSTPVNGTDSTPVNGTDSAPANGTDSIPVSGTDSTPVNGTDSTPMNGTDSAPINGTDSTSVTLPPQYVNANLKLSISDNNNTTLTNSNVRVVERDNVLAEVNTGNESTFEMEFILPSDGHLGVIVTKDGFASNGFQWQDGEDTNRTMYLMELQAADFVNNNGVFTTPLADPGIRLIGGTLVEEGTVEVFYDGAWGTICDDSWDVLDAQVVCRSLGYAGAIGAVSHAIFGEGSGQVLLDDLQCLGNESSIFDCPHPGVGTTNCGHNMDAGVRCLPDALVSAQFSSDSLSDDASAAYTLVSGGSRTIPQSVTIDENGDRRDTQQRVALYFSVLDSSGMEVDGISDVEFNLPIDSRDGLEDGDNLTAFYFNESTGLWSEGGVGTVFIDDDSSQLIWNFVAPVVKSWWAAGEILPLISVTSSTQDTPSTRDPLGTVVPINITVPSDQSSQDNSTISTPTTDTTTSSQDNGTISIPMTDSTTISPDNGTISTPMTDTTTSFPDNGTTSTPFMTDTTTSSPDNGTISTLMNDTTTSSPDNGTMSRPITTDTTASSPDNGTISTPIMTDTTASSPDNGTISTPIMTDTTTSSPDNGTISTPLNDTTTSFPDNGTTSTPFITDTTTSSPDNGTISSPTMTDTTTSSPDNGTTSTPFMTDTTTSSPDNGTISSPIMTDTTTSSPDNGTTSTPFMTDTTTSSPDNGTISSPIMTDTTTSSPDNGTLSTPIMTDTTTSSPDNGTISTLMNDTTTLSPDNGTISTLIMTDTSTSSPDNGTILTPMTDTALPPGSILANLSVSVVDTNNMPVTNARLLFRSLNGNGSSVTTDDSGAGKFETVIPEDGRIAIVASQSGYASNGLQWRPTDDQNITLRLLQLQIVTPAILGEYSVFEVTDNSTGENYVGITRVLSEQLSSENITTGAAMIVGGQSDVLPHTVIEDANGALQDVESLVAVELTVTDARGKDVEGMEDITFTLPLGVFNDLEEGDSVTAFFYKEETGLWEESGSGTIIEDPQGMRQWVFIAPHITWWMAGRPVDSPVTPTPSEPPTTELPSTTTGGYLGTILTQTQFYVVILLCILLILLMCLLSTWPCCDCRKKEKRNITFEPQEMLERRVSEAEENDYQDFVYTNRAMEEDEIDSSPSTSDRDVERGRDVAAEEEAEADELPAKIDIVSIITYETEPEREPDEGEEFTTFKGADEMNETAGEDETVMVDDKGVNAVNASPPDLVSAFKRGDTPTNARKVRFSESDQ